MWPLLTCLLLMGSSHPHLYTTPDDIAKAKLNIERFAWARATANEITANADKWAAMSDDKLRGLVPPPGSKYAYGFSGCPECNANWTWWGEGGVASLDKPNVVTCPKCKRAFPDKDHPDPGSGWRRPADGKIFYFAGIYNAYAAKQVTQALKWLALAYSITNDQKYSRAGAALFDRLADTYPTDTSGSMDYPSNPPSGRLEGPWYQVARRLVVLADCLDLFYESPEFAAPSAGGQGSVKRHIEESIIRDAGNYCYEQTIKGHMGLTNGQADYVRGTLAAGILLDVKDWIECGINGPFRLESFIDNCFDREGHYYETSLGYTDHAIRVLTDFAELLCNYRSSLHPDGVNLYSHSRFSQALFASGVDFDCFGHAPRFGDWWPDFDVVTTDRLFSWYPFVYSEVLAIRATDEESRTHWEAQREAAAFLGVEEMRARPLADNWRFWMLFHADPVSTPRAKPQLEQRPVLGGRGVAILRSGKGPSGRAALLRYGPTLNHGHLDSLGLLFYGLGRELTYDLGYQLGSAHVQTSWARLTASHNLVVVNEKNQMVSPSAGGDARFYVDATPVRAFEASDPSCYRSENVSEYGRAVALVDTGGSSYLVDIFRVTGGEKHDLLWHFSGEQSDTVGVDLGPTQDKGSLAGPDIDWGRKLGPAGDLIGCADKPPYWNAPPGNGYGFLFNCRRSTSLPPECKVSWNVGTTGRQSVLLHLLPEAGSELVTARAPGILPEWPQADYAIVRRQGPDLKSVFVSLVEPVSGKSAIRSVRRMDSRNAVCVEVETAAGTDYILSASVPGKCVFRLHSGENLGFDGRFGFLRITDGKMRRAVLVEGTEITLGPHRVTTPATEAIAKVKSVVLDGFTIELDKPVYSGTPGSYVYLSSPDYSHNSPYRILRQVRDARQAQGTASPDSPTLTFDAGFVLARGRISTSKPLVPDAIRTDVPLPRAIDMWGRPNGYLRGKYVRNDKTGKATTLVDVVKDQYTLRVKDASILPPGAPFTIYDVQPGDEVRIPATVVR